MKCGRCGHQKYMHSGKNARPDRCRSADCECPGWILAEGKPEPKKKKLVVQTHHITYEPERTVKIYKGEHFLLTRMQWRKNVSRGFLEALLQYVQDWKEKAVDA
jgi:hypothetical protein